MKQEQQAVTGNARLSRSAPEAQGISSSAVLAFVDAAEKADLGLHSLMLLRHGRVVAEGWWDPYGPSIPHMLFSLSKSFAAAAAGLAVAEGLFSLDDPVLSFFPDRGPAQVGPHLAAMRVRHLLSMSTGHDQDATGALRRDGSGDWVTAFLAQPVEHVPGTHFVYNSAATYMVSAIVQTVTGATLLDFLTPRLFAPLGINGPTWDSSPQGINTGGWGLSVTTEDIACFGQLYLQRGVWDGRPLLPEGWVAEATAKQVENGTDPDNDWAQGYGFQFWRCRHGAYRGDGAFGQFCVVMPDQDAVVAITAGTNDMGGILALIWDHLLPSMEPRPLPDDPAAQARLQDRLTHLSLRGPEGAAAPPLAATVSGRTYHFPPVGDDEDAVGILCDFYGSEASLTLRDRRGEHRVDVGSDTWLPGTTTLGVGSGGHLTSLDSGPARPCAARGGWVAADTYALQICYTETPFSLLLTARFTDDRLLLGVRQNVSFGITEFPMREGHIARQLS